MANTNSTPNYSLPLFVPEDKPSWLGSWNDAMTKIDIGIHGGSQQGDRNALAIQELSTKTDEQLVMINQNKEDITNLETRVQGVETYTSLVVPASIPSTIVPASYTDGDNSTTATFEKQSGGFLSFSINPVIATANAVAAIHTEVFIDGILSYISNDGVFVNSRKASIRTGFYFIPDGKTFAANISLNGQPPLQANVEPYFTPYKIYDVSTLQAVDPSEPPTQPEL